MTLYPEHGWLDRHQRLIMLALAVLGILFRIAWIGTNEVSLTALGEAVNVSRAFSETGTIADPFRRGQGPTAHVMPAPMLVAGLVYRQLGFDTRAANIVLTGWALLQIFASFWFLFKCFEEVGAPLGARLASFGALCLLPVNFPLETAFFRTWEGGLSVALASLFLWLVLRADRAPSLPLGRVAGLGLLAAVVLFVSPPMGIAAYLCGVLLLFRRVAPGRRVAAVAIVMVATATVLAPWTIRNYRTFGRLIPLRDNFGLEFAQANYDGAAAHPDNHAEFTRRHQEIHPYDGFNGYDRMIAAGGEAAYADRLDTQTKAWVRRHPGEFAMLSMRHLASMLFPPKWYFSHASASTMPKLALHWLVSLLGLLGIALALSRARARYEYLVIATLVPLLPYALVQPTLRYRYLVFGMLVYFASDGLARVISVRRAPATGDRIAA